MSLRSKIILALSLVAVLWAIADNVLLRTLVTSHFEEIAERKALDAIRGAEDDLDGTVDELRRFALAQSVGPQLREAVAAGDRAALRSLLTPEVLERGDLDLLIVVDEDGRVLRYWGRDAEGEVASYRLFPGEALSPTNPILRIPETQRFGSHLNTEHGYLAICSFPVVQPGFPLPTIEESGGDAELADGATLRAESQAMMIAGRLTPRVHSLESYGHPAEVRLTDTSLEELDDRQRSALDELDDGQVVHAFRASEDGGVSVYRCLDDPEGKPSLLLQVDVSPDALLEGQRVEQFLAISTLGTSALIFLVLLRLLQRTVIAPLTQLTSHAIEVGRTDDTSRRIGLEREDEIGQLSSEFDRMLDKLEESRRLLVVSARQAGMSEIATGVLHNVGNVLNSVNVSRSLIDKKLEEFAVRDLERVVDVLREHEHDLGSFIAKDPRGKNLLPFLEELSRALVGKHEEALAESENLRKGVDHIADLVRSQQAYAGARGVLERSSLADEIEGALKISVQAFGQDMDLDVVRSFADVPQVSIDRHKLMEILINLIQNAKQAMRSAGTQQPRLEVGLLQRDERVEIRISDNGEGIPTENLARIFGHGFTTKKDGHGFGLHVSANAATEMGGVLRAESDGPGTGATFTLSFPVESALPNIAA